MKRCLMCGAVDAYKVEEGLVLCAHCHEAREANLAANAAKEELNNVVDVDFTEAKEEDQEEGLRMKAVIVVGIAEDNSIVFDINGTDSNLMTLKGVAEYAVRRVDQMMEQKEYEVAMAMQQRAQAEAEEAENTEAQ